MKTRARWVTLGMTALLLALGGASSAQITPPDQPPQPRPPTTKPTHRPRPQPSATAPAPSSPEAVCKAAGGDWRDGQCDFARKVCQTAGNRWNEGEQRCELNCPQGSHQDGQRCAPDQPPPAPEVGPPPAQSTASPPPPASTASPAPAFPPRRSPSTAPGADSGGGELRTAAIIGGGVLLGAGLITGILTLAEKSSLEDRCVDKRCDPGAKSEYDDARTWGNVSTGTAIGGAVLLAAGLFLIPGSAKQEQPSAGAKVWINAGPTGAALAGQLTF